MAVIAVPGCRHDILGNNLKAIGILRTLAVCADAEHRDADAEGWWDLETACFQLHSRKYPTEDTLIEFFAQYYRPTLIFSPWNKGGGLDGQWEAVITFTPVQPDKKGHSKPRKPTRDDVNKLIRFLIRNRHALRQSGFEVRKKVRQLREKLPAKGEFSFVLDNEALPQLNSSDDQIKVRRRTKTSGKTDIIAILEQKYQQLISPDVIAVFRSFFDKFQSAQGSSQTLQVFELLRDEIPIESAIAIDAVLTTRVSAGNNPLFLRRGFSGSGRDELFRTFWNYFDTFRKHGKAYSYGSLLSRASLSGLPSKDNVGKGTPFFPDAVKTYNNGLEWIVETFPFNALDYLLAVEGALALRGGVARTLAASSRRFAAFPFVFDTGEDLVDDNNEVTGTASSVWLPLWDRPTTYEELESFICDAQARLPGKEARFSAEFARALRVQGVDAGFAGWQEFRFKMQASRVPWVCTGRYLGSIAEPSSVLLNDALAPIDESRFLDQFEPTHAGNKLDSRSPHPVRAELNAAIETAVAEPTPENALQILVMFFRACRQIALSKSFREKLRGDPIFFDGLPQEPWEALLQGLESVPEFRVARALSSISGLERQQRRANEKHVFSEVQPFLGSLLPLKLGRRGWYLPAESGDGTRQAVWNGLNLCGDLARVLARRYMDSLGDDLPALRSPRPAPLADVIAFLNGELDDHRIARWIEALSLIQWRWEQKEDSVAGSEQDSIANPLLEDWPAIPPAYASLRALLELECTWQAKDPSLWRKRRSQRPIALVCQRVGSSIALAVEDSLRWLSIWGVPNRWGEKAHREKSVLQGGDVIGLDHRQLDFQQQYTFVHRLATAVAIPLDWRDRWKIFRAVTLPQGN